MAPRAAGGARPERTLMRRWPAEWEPHAATWLSWPHNRETWPGTGRLEAAEDAFCEMVRALVPGERVEIHGGPPARQARIRACLEGAGVWDAERIRIHATPTDDAWVRDHGGIVAFDYAPDAPAAPVERVLVDFEYDAWGGKYPPWDQDAAVGRVMAEAMGIRREAFAFVLEGGSIDGDGAGTLLTTESCLLNPNRDRPGLDRSRAALEALLAEALGARRVVWLADGVEGDDTDGHIDDLTRFVAPGRVVTVVEPDPADPNHAVLAENLRRLEAAEDGAGRSLEVVPLPMPPPVEGPEGRLPASYANFYFANAGLLVPVFGVDTDREALAILEAAVPDRPVLPIPARALVLGLGAVHCLTQQEPAAPARLPDPASA